LLGGAVIGSKVGLSNTYYNPGALGLLERPSLVLSSLAVQLTSVSVPQASPSKDIRNVSLSTVPSFVAGTLWFRVLGGSQLAYSFLTRQDFDVRLQSRVELDAPGSGGAPDTIRAGEILTEASAIENWVGLTWSREMTKGLGIGLTQYVAYRGQRTRGQVIAQEAVSGDPGSAAHLVDEFDFWHFRTLTKLGALYENEDYSFGITATTPSLGIMGSGSVYTSIYDPVSMPSTPLSAVNLQEDLNPKYKSRWALGAGATYKRKNTRVHASFEWYQAIPKNEVLPAQPFPESSSGLQLTNSAVQELDSVTNYGIGVEHTLNSKLDLYVSFITNFSALPRQTDANMGIATLDIYQVTGGGNFSLLGIEFTLGLEYGFGQSDLELLRFIDSGQTADLSFEARHQKVEYGRLEGFLGFTFLFGDDPDAAAAP
jgi:hypothetical protein